MLRPALHRMLPVQFSTWSDLVQIIWGSNVHGILATIANAGQIFDRTTDSFNDKGSIERPLQGNTLINSV